MTTQDTAPRYYVVTRDGEERGRTLTEADALHLLHTLQGQSAHHAITFGGWDIVTPSGDTWSGFYRANTKGRV